MRQWDRKPPLMDKKAFFLSAAVLGSMALLLILGLTPGGAQAPAQEEAAQVGSGTAVVLSEGCQMIQHMSYLPCGHSLTRRQTLPAEMNGKTREDLAAAYDLWQVTSFSPTEVEMEQALNMFCPDHVVLMPDESGMLCIWQNRYGDALALVRELNQPISDLPDAYQEMLRPGKGFPTQEDLEKWLESVES